MFISSVSLFDRWFSSSSGRGHVDSACVWSPPADCDHCSPLQSSRWENQTNIYPNVWPSSVQQSSSLYVCDFQWSGDHLLETQWVTDPDWSELMCSDEEPQSSSHADSDVFYLTGVWRRWLHRGLWQCWRIFCFCQISPIQQLNTDIKSKHEFITSV